MFLLKNLFGSIGSLTDRVICVVFAIFFAQTPIYMGLYVNVLAGAQMESRKTFDDLDSRAAKYDLSVDEFLGQLLDNPDQMVKENAEASHNTVKRYRRYTEALEALLNSSVWIKPFHLIRYYDPSIHASMEFEPGLPLTFEGFVYGLLGVLLAMALIGLIKSIFGRIFRKNDEEESPGKTLAEKAEMREP